MRNKLTKLSIVLLSCSSTLLFAGSFNSSESDYAQSDYDPFLELEDTANTDEENLDSMLNDFVDLVDSIDEEEQAKSFKPKRQESVSNTFSSRELAIGATGWNTLEAIDNQCQQTLKTNFMYKEQLADLGGKYQQKNIRANICECVSDVAMDNISDDHLEKASKSSTYQRKLIEKVVEGALFACYDKVVHK